MKKKPAKSAKTVSSSNDALKLGGLYILAFLTFQMVNFINESIQGAEFNRAIDVVEIQTKGIAQLGAFLVAYFITLIYIKNRIYS